MEIYLLPFANATLSASLADGSAQLLASYSMDAYLQGAFSLGESLDLQLEAALRGQAAS